MSEEEVSRFERRAAARTEWERIIDVHEASGQIAAVESRFGTNLVSRFDYASDRLGRMTSAVSAVSTNLFTYDGLDLVSETWNGAAISRATDALGRPASLSFGAPGHFSVSYAYDAFGRFAAVTSSVSSVTSVANYSRLPGSDLLEATSFTIGGSAFDVRRSYEPARSLVTSVSNAYGGTLISRYDYENDALGRRTAVTRSGAAFDAPPVRDAYGYNARSEVTSARRTPVGLSTELRGFSYDYEYDPIGNRVASAEYDHEGNAMVSDYAANALNQYEQRTVPGYAGVRGTADAHATVTVNANPAWRWGGYFYGGDSADNSLAAVMKELEVMAVLNPPGTNDPDIVTSQTGRVFVAQTPEAFQYDEDGNLTQDGRFTYTWDAEHRLISVTTRNDLPAYVPRVKVEYTYDHQSRRIASATAVWTNDAWQAVEFRTFLYDGWNVITETIQNPQSQISNHYVWGLDLSGTLQGAGGIGGLLAASLDGVTALYCYDANGNVGQLVDAAGELLAHYEYSPFGETVVSTGPLAKANPIRFSTKWFDNDTGLGYWGYRYYHPEMGRWMSRDPRKELGFKIGQDFRSRMAFQGARDQMAASIDMIAANAAPGSLEEALARSLQQLAAKLRSVTYEEFAASQGNLYGFIGNNPINLIDILGLEEGDTNDQPWPPNDPGEGKEGDWGDLFKALWKWFEQNHKADIDEVKKKAEDWAKENKVKACCIAGAGATVAVIAEKQFTDKITIPKIPITITKGVKFSAKGSKECSGNGELKVEVKFTWEF